MGMAQVRSPEDWCETLKSKSRAEAGAQGVAQEMSAIILTEGSEGAGSASKWACAHLWDGGRGG